MTAVAVASGVPPDVEGGVSPPGKGRVTGLVLLAATLLSAVQTLAGSPATSRELFNDHWLFTKGDPPGIETRLDYPTLKPWLLSVGAELSVNSPAPARPSGNPGADVPYTQPGFADAGWRQLNLPHDWGIEGPFKQEYPGDTGKLPWWGVGWYRKHFQVPSGAGDHQFYLDIDGAMAYASVWLNGQFVGGWPYGYASWRLDLTPHIKAGAENVLAIRIDNPPNSSRWYPGGGIYRNVWLVQSPAVHFAHWGIYVTTPQVSKEQAQVVLRANIDNAKSASENLTLQAEIYRADPDGNRVGRPVASTVPTSVTAAPGTTPNLSLSCTVRAPKFWSLKRPARYVAVLTLARDGSPIDAAETPFGFRTIQFTADHGFLLNGERVALNGVCDHHDLGALGSALNTRALERQIDLLQEMGCNAIRTSHNPPAPELLELCDRKGMLVMDESFDCWARGKTKNDYHLLFPDWHEKDMRALVRRDRNHPCVILWSIGNEIPEQWSTNGQVLAAELAAIVRSEDPTRPVTAACNDTKAGYNGFQKQLDVFGYNYKPEEYGKFRTANPAIPLFGSETASCVSSRGEYFFPVSTNKSRGHADFQMSSYDLYAPPWATPPDTEFHGQDAFPFVAGEFVWTGFDYIGEPTPYNSDTSNLLNFTDPKEKERFAEQLKELGKIRVPSRSSYFGIIDLAGFKKDRFYLYQARWRPELRMAHLLPHWTWPERVGQVTPVHVYTSGDAAELFLNGKSLGRKSRGPFAYRLHWDEVVYEPGELKVIAYKNGSRWAEDTVRTAGPAARLVLSADRPAIHADGRDLSFVTVKVTDASGTLAPRARNHIVFEVSGPGEIAAVDDGDATSFEPFQAKEHNAFNGLCLVVIRSTGERGPILLKASSGALQSAQAKLLAR